MNQSTLILFSSPSPKTMPSSSQPRRLGAFSTRTMRSVASAQNSMSSAFIEKKWLLPR
jgi:hypothetical protein